MKKINKLMLIGSLSLLSIGSISIPFITTSCSSSNEYTDSPDLIERYKGADSNLIQGGLFNDKEKMTVEQINKFWIKINSSTKKFGICSYHSTNGFIANYYTPGYEPNPGTENLPKPSNNNIVNEQSNTIRIPNKIYYNNEIYELEFLNLETSVIVSPPNCIKVIEFDPTIKLNLNLNNRKGSKPVYNNIVIGSGNDSENLLSSLKKILNLPLYNEALNTNFHCYEIIDLWRDNILIDEITFNQNKPFGYDENDKEKWVTAPYINVMYSLDSKPKEISLPNYVQVLPYKFLTLQPDYAVHDSPTIDFIINIPPSIKECGKYPFMLETFSGDFKYIINVNSTTDDIYFKIKSSFETYANDPDVNHHGYNNDMRFIEVHLNYV